MNYSVATDYNNLNSGKGFKKGSTTVNVDGSPDTSLNLLWTTNLESGDDYILATDSFTANHTANTSSAIPVFYTMPRSIDGIISASNGLPSSPRNFTTSGSGLNFIASNNYFILDPNNPLPNIVTTGSVLILDAKQISSYPTTASTWYDLSGYSSNGILQNGTGFDPTQNVLTFDGVDDRVDITFNNRLNSYSGSLEMVVERKGTTSNSFPFGGVAALTNRFYIRQNGPSTYDAVRGNPISNSQFGTLDLDRYYHLVVTWDPSNLYTYKNGILFDSTTYTNPGTELVSGDLGRGAGSYTTMNLGDFKAYNKTLTQAEILQNYYGGPIVTDGLVFAVDASNLVSYESGSLSTYSLTGSFTGSLDNGTSFSNINGGSWVFDGVDDFINVPINAAFNTPSVTFEVWANLQTINDRHIVYVNWQGNSLEVPSDRSIVMYNYNSAGQQGARTAGGVIEWDTWNHFVGTYDSGSQTLRTYVNGVLLATRTNTLATIYSVYVHKISGTNFGGEVKGNISIVRHYNRALSASEIAQNFNAQRTRFGI